MTTLPQLCERFGIDPAAAQAAVSAPADHDHAPWYVEVVLGIGAGRKMPHWDETKGQFVPVTEAYLTLSFDHRVLDGGGAGRLLKRIADLLQEPEKL